MNLSIRPATLQEKMYTYPQSQQLIGQPGCIGLLRGDMGSSGTGFFSLWDSYFATLKTASFTAEFDDVVNALRFDAQYGGILKSRESMANYCHRYPESSFENAREYGFRVDTEKYAYLMRLSPLPGEYSFYIYCYMREWLDCHLKQAEKGIRIIDSSYRDLFCIPDGGQIQVTHHDRSVAQYTCRFIDEYHLQVGNSLFHICEFAEALEHNGSTVSPLHSTRPQA